jgi:hypothetical protein
LRFFAPKIEIKQSKRPKKIKQSIPLCYPTIPSHSENKSKQSKSRDNPGKYSTLRVRSAPLKSISCRPHPHSLGRDFRAAQVGVGEVVGPIEVDFAIQPTLARQRPASRRPAQVWDYFKYSIA